MRRSWIASLTAIAALCALPTFVHAQTITTGALGGTVSDSAGLLLSDVTVTLTSNEGGATRLLTTGMDGQFRFALVLPGTYRVLIERLGYRPKLIDQIPIRPGVDLQLDASVVAARPPVDAPERVVFGVPASSPGVSDWISALSFERVPWARRETSEIAALSSKSSDLLEVEGLPRSLSTVKVDGLPYVAARHWGLEGTPNNEIALPINVLQSAQLVTADADAEWTGFAGGALAVNTKRGAPDFALETFGSWSGSSLHKSKFIDDANPSNNSMWGGLLMRGPVLRDTAHFVLALEARKLDTPLPRPWQRDATVDAALLQVADSAFGIDLQPFTQPYVLQSNVVSGFGRFDWQVSNDNAFSFRAGFGNISRAQGAPEVAGSVLPQLIGAGHDVFLSAALQSKIAGKFAHELRAGFVTSNRDYMGGGDSGTSGAGDVSTLVIPGMLRFGPDSRLPGKFKRMEINLDQSLQLGFSTHQFKVGLEGAATWHDNSYTSASAGSFIFGGANEFGLSSGEFVQTSVSGAGQTKFNLARYGVFIQDRWSAAPGLHLSLGVRYDIATLPLADVTLNEAWQTASGMATNTAARKVKVASPRFALTYDGGAGRHWLVTVSGGRYVGELDPEIMGDVLLGDGDLKVTHALGSLGGWPTPVAGNLPASLPELTLLGPKFRPPQTDRFAFGVSRSLSATTVQVSAAYRFTDFLVRRSDLNLFSDPIAHDQYGRPLFGSLVQSGALLAVAQPNRRFTDFDRVTAIAADGWSRYWGVTAGIQHDVARSLGLFASYTHSSTRDTWLVDRGGDAQSQITPFPDNSVADWTEGRSAFDVPDRIAAGLELRPGGGLDPRATVIYRFASGYPFTPGFSTGVDANGDGSDSNDPAFIDDQVAGAAQVLQSWPCLRNQVGHFAERNSCRQANVHSLDVRLGVTIAHSARTSAELFVDGINLIESNLGLPDRALYTIDSTRSLIIDQNAGTVNVPLVANPHFGEPLVRYGAGRLFRVGLQVNY